MVGPLLSNHSEHTILLKLCDIASGYRLNSSDEWQWGIGLWIVGDLLGLSWGVVEDASLGLGNEGFSMSWIEDEFADVGLESLSVDVEGLLASVLSSVVNSDTN